jgi:hypothetical protein
LENITPSVHEARADLSSGVRRVVTAGRVGLLVCFFFFLAVYGISSRGKLQASDEAAVFASGVSLATRGHLSIDDLEWLQERVNIGARGPDGHLYTKYFPGNVFAVAFVYKLTARANDQPYIWTQEIAPSLSGARWALRVNAFWGALGMTFLLALLRRFFSWPTAIVIVLLVGLCSDWWYQSRGLYSEVGGSAFLIASLYFAVSEKPYRSGLALALSILFRPTNLVALPFWGWSVWRKGLSALPSAVALVGGIALLAAYNSARFGSPLNFGYPEGNLSVPFFTGLHAMFLSPGRSLFVYSPILLLAIPGAWTFFKRERWLTISCLFVILSYAAIVASWGPLGWGLSWGMRLMTPTVPVLGFLAAPVVDYAWRNKWTIIAPLTLGLAGFSIQIVALLRDPTHVLIDRVQNGDVKFEETIYSVRHSWIALQFDAARNRQPCELDSYTLRRLLTNCPD